MDLKNWAFRRPYCNPNAGFVLGKTAEEAIKLIHFAYGYASETTVFCAETKTQFIDIEGQIKKVELKT